jgi:hypothetical protein
MGTCGPFTDVAGDAFCPFVLGIFYTGITTGTTATSYDPTANVSRLQMAAFLSRSVDGILKRGSRRAILDQFWTTQNSTVLGITTLGGAFTNPRAVRSDGADLWVGNFNANTISRVRASDGKLLESWTAAGPGGIRVAMGRVVATGNVSTGSLYTIDPSQAAGAATVVASNLGAFPNGLAFDGARFWSANQNGVSIATPGATIPWTVTTVAAGFTGPFGATYDGTNVWITDAPNKLLKLDPAGAILATVTVGAGPRHPVFDGTNIWVPGGSSSDVTVVRASSGAILATLTGNGLSGPIEAAFDGQRILVTSPTANMVSLFKAVDLSILGAFPITGSPYGACSDGIHFWITLTDGNKLARF